MTYIDNNSNFDRGNNIGRYRKTETLRYLKSDCHLHKKIILFNESHLKMMKNDFYFILKVLFVHKIFKFLL